MRRGDVDVRVCTFLDVRSAYSPFIYSLSSCFAFLSSSWTSLDLRSFVLYSSTMVPAVSPYSILSLFLSLSSSFLFLSIDLSPLYRRPFLSRVFSVLIIIERRTSFSLSSKLNFVIVIFLTLYLLL